MDNLIPNYGEALKKNHDKNDVVARWMVPLRGKLYDVEFEHGTVSGKRVIWVNGEVSGLTQFMNLPSFFKRFFIWFSEGNSPKRYHV
jgi:hypothetical protein